MWTKDANLMVSRDPGFDTHWTLGDGGVAWQQALDYVAKLNNEAYLGYNDWRLPNINELESLVDAERWQPSLPFSHPFTNVPSSEYWNGFYWSSTSYASGPHQAWVVNINDGYVWATDKPNIPSSWPVHVWPVRSGQTGAIQLHRTGQTTCYDSAGAVIPCAGTGGEGQDGDIQAGVPWPSTRFMDNGDGTVTDNLTGLMWTKDANFPGVRKTWQDALDYVAGMNAGIYPNLGYIDWRLSNRKELSSLIDRSRSNPALPIGHPFINVDGNWSSTSYPYYGVASNAWIVSMSDGYVPAMGKSNYSYPVWPVRGGQIPTDFGTINVTFDTTDQSGQHLDGGVLWGTGAPPIDPATHHGAYAPATVTHADGGTHSLRGEWGGLSSPGVSLTIFKDTTYWVDALTGNVTTESTPGINRVNFVFNVNQPPVADDQSITTQEDTSVTINITGNEPDGDPLTFSVVTGPLNGILSGLAPHVTYTPNGNFNGLDSFSFKVNDGLAYSNTATVSIMVSAVNDEPVVWNIPDVSFDEDGNGTLPGNASLDSYVNDIETLDPFIVWTVIGGTNVAASINSDRTVTFTAVPNFNGKETLTFMATDTGDGTSGPLIASDTMVVTVRPVNDPPVLDSIGSKSVDENSLLTFTVGGNDPEGDILTFDAMGLPAGAAFDQYTQTFSWTPDYTQAGTHFVTFTVSDGSLDDSEVVNITVNNVNRPPMADAGTGETVHVDSVVTLNGGNSSDPDGNYPLTYSWSIISKPTGSTATLSMPTAVNPSFKADMIGVYEVGLVVTDSLGLSSLTDSVVINTYNTPPVADAGTDQAVIVRGTTVQLDGTQSYDLDGDTIYYSWTITRRPAGSTSVLSDPASPTPTFVADVYGEYKFELVVYDSWAVSAPDSVIVSFTNVKPAANPGGNQAVIEGNTVFLNGSGSSDANGDPLTYNWTFVSIPMGSTTTLTSTISVTTSFVADMPGTYVVSLIVNDGFVNSDPANVTITATSRQDAVIRILIESNNIINNLSPNVFINRNMANALTNKINATLEMIDQGLYQDALDKQENDVLGKTDGCAATGSPDRNDWIRDCGAQGQVYPLTLRAIELLRGLI